MSVVKEDIVRAIRELGVTEGDVVVVHSSMKSMGHVEGGPDTVIDAFLEVLGKEGTLVFPTLSQKDFDKAYIEWNMDRPSDVGLITEVFRKRAESKRSDQETHSVAAQGKLADELTREHKAYGPRFGAFGEYAFSHSSPWQKLYDLGAKAVFVGVHTRSHTAKHLGEYMYVEKLLEKYKDVDGIDELKYELSHFDKNRAWRGWETAWPYMNGMRLHDEYQKHCLMKSSKCGEAEFLCMPVRETVDLVVSFMENDTQAWFSAESRFTVWKNRLDALLEEK